MNIRLLFSVSVIRCLEHSSKVIAGTLQGIKRKFKFSHLIVSGRLLNLTQNNNISKAEFQENVTKPVITNINKYKLEEQRKVQTNVNR